MSESSSDLAEVAPGEAGPGLEVWDASCDAIDLARTQAAVLERMFGERTRPTTIGRFVVTGTAGAGEMGRVYVAYDPELDRKVALKLIRSQHLDRDEAEVRRKRLVREAQAMARLSHPNVITVHEVGRLGGDVFIVMEYISGSSLRRWLQIKPRTWAEILPVFVDAGRGLAAAHASNLVHRDFKPDNVLVADDGRVVVLDFGLARSPIGASRTDEDGADDGARPPPSATPTAGANLTRTGAVIGTPAYMAPEQYRGTAADARSDQFSFAVALFEAVHGVRPFSSPTWDELSEQIRRGKLPAPRKIPDWLQSCLARSLRYDPNERYPSMGAVVAELARHRRSAWPLAALGLVAIALVLAGALGSRAIDERPQCDGGVSRLRAVWGPEHSAALTSAFAATELPYAAASAKRVVARFDEYAAGWSAMHRDACERSVVRHEQSQELMDLRMACLDQRLAELDGAATLLAAPDQALVERAQNVVSALGHIEDCANAEQLRSAVPLPEDPQLRRAVDTQRVRLAHMHAMTSGGRIEQALTLATDVVKESESIGYQPLLATALRWRGTVERRAGRKESERTLLDAVKLAEGLRQDEDALEAWRHLSEGVHGDAQADARNSIYIERFEAATVRLGNQPRMLAALDGVRGDAAVRAGEYEQAARYFQAMIDRVPYEDEPITISGARLDLGRAWFKLGRLQDAAEEFARLVDLYEDFYGPEHPDTARALNNRAVALVAMGKNVEAIPLLDRSLTIQRAALGPDHPRLGTTLNALASAYYQLGEFEAAADRYRDALRIAEAALGPDSVRLAPPMGNLAQTLSLLGRHEEAIVQAKRAVDIVERAKGSDHPGLAAPLAALAEAYSRGQQPEQSVRIRRQALEIRKQRLGLDHVETGYAERGLADAYRSMEAWGKAATHARRAVDIVEAQLGAAHPQLAASLTTLGQIELGRERAESAGKAFARAMEIYGVAEAAPQQAAEAKFGLAEALVALDQDRERAIALASEAREAFAARGDALKDRVEQVDEALASWQ